LKILILGSTGFLGKAIYEKLRIFPKLSISLSRREDFIEKKNAILISKDLQEGILDSDICINCIANTNFIDCENIDKPPFANILIPQEVCKIAKPSCYLIHFSSDIFYENEENNSQEDDKLVINNAYAEQKKYAEDIFLEKNSLIIRTSFVGNNHRNIGLFNHVYSSITNDNKIDGWSNVYSSSVSISQVTDLIENIINKQSNLIGIYNFGTSESYTKYDYIFNLLKLYKKEHLLNKIEYIPHLLNRNLNSGMLSRKITNNIDINLPTFKDVIKDSHYDLKFLYSNSE